MLRGGFVPTPDRDDDDCDESAWVKSGTACALVLLAVLVVCAGVILAARVHGATPSAKANTPEVPVNGTLPVARAVPASPRASGSGSASSWPPAPADVTWLQVGLGALPFSPGAGPSVVIAGVPSGFAHTPPGAVIASMQILGRLSWSAQTNASMRAVAASCTMPAAAAVPSLTYGPPTDPSVIPAVAGFQIVTYDPAQAVVNIALRFNGTLRVASTRMQWSASDWKLSGAPGPLGQTSWAAVDDLSGYVLFSGQPTKAGD